MSGAPWTHDIHGFLKPRYRGLVHLWAIGPMLVAGSLLTALAPTTATRICVAVYTVGIVGMLASSATYHRAHVTEKTRTWLRRLDHSMIGVAVAGTFTPVAWLVLEGSLRTTLLSLLWVGAIGSFVLSFAWPQAPRPLRSAVYVALGWGGGIAMPWLLTHGGALAFTFFVLGGLLYSAGAVIYAIRKPNPWPTMFGFHEIFHTMVLLAAISHFIGVALVVQKVG